LKSDILTGNSKLASCEFEQLALFLVVAQLK